VEDLGYATLALSLLFLLGVSIGFILALWAGAKRDAGAEALALIAGAVEIQNAARRALPGSALLDAAQPFAGARRRTRELVASDVPPVVAQQPEASQARLARLQMARLASSRALAPGPHRLTFQPVAAAGVVHREHE
jgi:pimeloyl-ACP methyl ester carboxylesterase